MSPAERTALLKSPPVSRELGGGLDGGPSIWEADASGIACYAAPKELPGTVPLYRLYHPPVFKDGGNYLCFNGHDSLYTTSEKEMSDHITQHGYKFVGIEGYVWPQPAMVSMLPPPPPGPKIGAGKPAANPDTDLLNRGCTRTGIGSYNCPTVVAYAACESYKNGGKVQDCTTPVDLTRQKAMDKELFSVGCKRFLGRPDEFICVTQKSFDLCETYHKNGTAKKCWPAKKE